MSLRDANTVFQGRPERSSQECTDSSTIYAPEYDAGQERYHPIVYILDQEQDAFQSLTTVLDSNGIDTLFCRHIFHFFHTLRRSRIGCIIAQYDSPEMNGVDLLLALQQQQVDLPVILSSRDSHVQAVVESMQAGAVSFFEKPLELELVFESVVAAIEQHREMRRFTARAVEMFERYDQLSESECEVCDALVHGKPNKVIAAELDIGLRTVELRRASIMKKMAVDSLAGLVRVRLEMEHFAQVQAGTMAGSMANSVPRGRCVGEYSCEHGHVGA